MMMKPARRVQDEQDFLRMAAIELRRMAEQSPDIAAELRYVAQQVEAESEDLARQRERGGQCLTSSK
jgi:hypothetical protein